MRGEMLLGREERWGLDCQRIASGNGTDNKHRGNTRAFYRHGVSVWEGLLVGVLPQSLTTRQQRFHVCPVPGLLVAQTPMTASKPSWKGVC